MVSVLPDSSMWTLSFDGGERPFRVAVPLDRIAELLAGFDGRQRAFLLALLNGCSKRAAAASAGVATRTAQLWAKKDGRFADAVQYCEEVGFGAVIEPELYRRALAGVDDPGSMRALELIVRSRRAEYREKVSTGSEGRG